MASSIIGTLDRCCALAYSSTVKIVVLLWLSYSVMNLNAEFEDDI
jgi:hypothetical protein